MGAVTKQLKNERLYYAMVHAPEPPRQSILRHLWRQSGPSQFILFVVGPGQSQFNSTQTAPAQKSRYSLLYSFTVMFPGATKYLEKMNVSTMKKAPLNYFSKLVHMMMHRQQEQGHQHQQVSIYWRPRMQAPYLAMQLETREPQTRTHYALTLYTIVFRVQWISYNWC